MILMFACAAFAFFFALLDTSEENPISCKSAAGNPFLLPGIPLIVLGLIQLINPDIRVCEYEGMQCVKDLEHIGFLPSGTIRDLYFSDTPYALITLTAAWYFATTGWMYTRGGNFATIALKFFALNGALMGALALAQKYTNAQGIYWCISTNSAFYGTFFLVNAAGNFLTMAAAACFALSFASDKKNFPRDFALWSALGLFSIFCVLQCTSIGAKVISLALLTVHALTALWFFTRSKLLVSTISLLLVAAASLFVAYNGINSATFLESKYKNAEQSLNSRITINKISREIFAENPVCGSGAGSYGIRAGTIPDAPKYIKGRNIIINAAHNDLFEYACEYGVIGLFAIFSCFFIWLVNLIKIRRTLACANVILIFAIAISTIHSMVDLHLHIPATMFVFVLLMSLSTAKLGEKYE